MPTVSQQLIRGCVAGILAKIPQGLALYVCSELGLFLVMGVALNVPLTILYSSKHVLLGGLFGALFAVPLLKGWPHWVRGTLVGLAHAAGTLFVFNPFVDGVGFLGLDVGALMPLVVVAANLVWGMLAGVGVDLWGLTDRRAAAQ
jgi:hypothetical protein